MKKMSALVERRFDAWVKELTEWLAIPSISADPAHKADVRRAGEWAMAQLKVRGLKTEMVETKGHPLVYAEWLGAKGRPTLLFYGHFDVQPADPVAEWKTPAFAPTVRKGQIYARGATDDKGQVFCFLKALEVLQVEGSYPVNIKVLLEGEEEVGGESIEAWVPKNAKKLAADAVLVCDSGMLSEKVPAIETGLRGLVYFEAEVRGSATDLHSGLYGGVAPNPIFALATMIAAIRDKDGNLHVPGLEKLLPPCPAEEEKFWRADPLKITAAWKKEMGVKELVGPKKIAPLKRVMAWPTFEVHGIKGGFVGEGAKTVIPAVAVAKLSMRLPGGVDAHKAWALLQKALKAALPAGHKLELRLLSAGPGVVVSPKSAAMKAASVALEEVFGVAPKYVRGGGSIPVVALFDRVLKVPCVLMGFSFPDDGLHAPNEKFPLIQIKRGALAIAGFMKRLGTK